MTEAGGGRRGRDLQHVAGAVGEAEFLDGVVGAAGQRGEVGEVAGIQARRLQDVPGPFPGVHHRAPTLPFAFGQPAAYTSST
ncbi:hypothetical protein SVIOM74S_06908 [Streptomyces violarus]